MASAFPPTLEGRTKAEQPFVNQLVALEAVRFSNPCARALAQAGVSFAVWVSGAMKARPGVGVRRSSVPLNQARPETSVAFTRDALHSAFARAIERDAAQYPAYRDGIVVKPDSADPPPPANDVELFPALAEYRASMGV